MTIRRAQHEYLTPGHIPIAERCPSLFWPGRLPTGVLLGGRLQARVNLGQWAVQCPSCRSAQTASPDDPRFFCVECGSGWHEVEFPANVDELEALLDVRGLLRHRNWLPGETAADLARENAEHPDDLAAPATSLALPAPGQHLLSALMGV